MFDVNTSEKIDAAFIEGLTERERRFINALASGLSLMSAWAAIGENLMPGWKADARDLEKRLGKRVDPGFQESIARLREIATSDASALFDSEGRLDPEAIRKAGKIIKRIEFDPDGKIAAIQLESRIDAARLLAKLIG